MSSMSFMPLFKISGDECRRHTASTASDLYSLAAHVILQHVLPVRITLQLLRLCASDTHAMVPWGSPALNTRMLHPLPEHSAWSSVGSLQAKTKGSPGVRALQESAGWLDAAVGHSPRQ